MRRWGEEGEEEKEEKGEEEQEGTAGMVSCSAVTGTGSRAG